MKSNSKKFDGKRLLILGSNAGSEDIVRYAQSNGAYVYVTDYLSLDESPAKALANEPVYISTADINGLESLINEKGIDGVFAGVSEFNLQKALELSELCGLNFYCNSQQWDQIESKDKFRKLCIEHGVPCPCLIYTGDEIGSISWQDINYPVVVKPVDCGASLGVHICHTENELRMAAADSLEKSGSGKIIVESFCFGHEFTAHYTICNGRVALACIDNRYPVSVHEGSVTTIPAARVYPCLFIDEYINQVNDRMIKLVESLGLRNAVLFIQGLYDEESNKFSIFEAGLRSAAELPSRLISKISGLDYMSLLVDQILLGHVIDYDQSREDPYLQGKVAGVISLVGRHGLVHEITDVKSFILSLPQVVDYEIRYPYGSVIPDTDTLRQLAVRFVLVCETRAQLIDCASHIYETVRLADPKGRSLVVEFNPSRIFGLI